MEFTDRSPDRPLSFAASLDLESTRLVSNRDGSVPPWANCVILGPSPVNLLANDYSWAPSEQAKRKPFNPTAPQTSRESAMLRRWQAEDLSRFYVEQHSNRRR